MGAIFPAFVWLVFNLWIASGLYMTASSIRCGGGIHVKDFVLLLALALNLHVVGSLMYWIELRKVDDYEHHGPQQEWAYKKGDTWVRLPDDIQKIIRGGVSAGKTTVPCELYGLVFDLNAETVTYVTTGQSYKMCHKQVARSLREKRDWFASTVRILRYFAVFLIFALLVYGVVRVAQKLNLENHGGEGSAVWLIIVLVVTFLILACILLSIYCVVQAHPRNRNRKYGLPCFPADEEEPGQHNESDSDSGDEYC